MRKSNDLWKLTIMLVAAMSFALAGPGCSDDESSSSDSGGDVTGDTTPDTTGDTEEDMVPDAEPDMEPDMVEDMVPDTEADMVPDVVEDVPAPEDECLAFVADLTADDGALQSALGLVIASCGRGATMCLTCALGNTNACGGNAAWSNYVDCADAGTPDSECDLSSCIERCIEENPFEADSPQSDAADAVNGSSLSGECLGCFTGITQCIADNGCSASCVSSDCACDSCQCDEGCVDEFSTCSGLPATVDCSDVPDDPAACLTDGDPNGTCDDNSVESCQVPAQ